MQKFTSTIPAHVEKIVFMDGKTIENTEVMFFDQFIIVSNSGEGETDAPCFYNVATISKLIGVKEIQPKKGKVMII